MARKKAGAALLGLLLVGAGARPPEDGSAAIKVRVVKGRTEAAVDLSDIFGPDRQREFGNGLDNVVEIYTSVVPAGGGPPASLHGRIVEILFDVWEETYAVSVKDPEHPAGRRLVLRDFAALRAFLSDQKGLDLGPVEALPDAFRVEVRVEVNPISREQLQRTREYIAAASGSRQSGSRSVLGAVASFLLREPNAGSDVHLLRSPPLTRAGIAPP
ncbi:MAG TPA: hypothetical protein VMU15_03530 [Anaeromyxobacter sp.]|nr:hypothetical protein [Anaeromyxobacter sp.]